MKKAHLISDYANRFGVFHDVEGYESEGFESLKARVERGMDVLSDYPQLFKIKEYLSFGEWYYRLFFTVTPLPLARELHRIHKKWAGNEDFLFDTTPQRYTVIEDVPNTVVNELLTKDEIKELEHYRGWPMG